MFSYHGYKLSDSKRVPSQFLSKIFQGFLNHEIKNRAGMAYNISCNSSYTGTFGIFALYAATNENNTPKVIHEFKKVLCNADEIISKDHLQKTRNQMISEFIFDFEKTSLRTEFYSERVLYGNQGDNHQKELELIKNTKVEDILRVIEDLRSQEPKITVFSNAHTKRDISDVYQKGL